MNVNLKYFVALGCVLFGGALYAMHTEKMRVTMVCHDARLYMDGGVDATLESGGINFHRSLKLFRKHNHDEKFVGGEAVNAEVSGHGSDDVYFAKDLQLTVYKNRTPSERGVPAHLVAMLQGEKIDVAMNCKKK